MARARHVSCTTAALYPGGFEFDNELTDGLTVRGVTGILPGAFPVAPGVDVRSASVERGWCVGCGVGVAAGQVCEGVFELGRADDLDVGVEPADGGGQAGP